MSSEVPSHSNGDHVFLPPKEPLRTSALVGSLLSSTVPEYEQQFLIVKEAWLKTPYSAQLASIIAQVISDRNESPITNAVCLGIGGKSGRDTLQFLVFSQAVAQLATAYPRILDNIVVQDLQMREGFQKLLERYGCKIVDDPEAFSYIGKETFLLACCLPVPEICHLMIGRPVNELPLFLGNDIRFYWSQFFPAICIDAPLFFFFGSETDE
jgi:SRR1 domain